MEELGMFSNFLRDLQDINEINSFLNGNSTKPKTTIKYKKRLNPFSDLSENEFKKRYHFSMENMRRIIDMVRDDLLEVDQIETRTNQVPVELQIMSAIRFFCGEHPEIIAIAHSITVKTLFKICKRVAVALAAKSSRYIRMPATLSEKENVTSAFNEIANMPQVIGALKEFNVRLRRCHFDNDGSVQYHVNKSFNEYLQIQIISDASFKIRNLDCKLLSRKEDNDSKEMFTHTRIKERFEQNEFRGRVLLADNNLNCCSYLFTPVQFPITKEELAFNKAHEATFNTVNNCLKLWKKRFVVLDSGISFSSLSCAKQIITALALLHNMAIDWHDTAIDGTSNSSGFELISTNIGTQARSDFIKAIFNQ